jgi:DNA-binding CsgD family transcriptional regulator
LQKPLGKEDKRKLRKEARNRIVEDWLAPSGSEQEKQLLRIWAKSGSVSREDLQLIDQWLKDPEAVRRGRDPLFLYAAKKKYLGEVIWNTAAERHKQLDDREWLVAYFTAQGKAQKRIATLTNLSERSVDDIISRIKDRITMEYRCSLESVGIAQITRWFLGQ